MRLNRFLKESAIIPSLLTHPLYGAEPSPPPEELARVQEGVIGEFVEVFDASKQVSNAKRLREDLLARERRTSTAVGRGIAFPHVRTQQARRFAIALGRSELGLPFGAPDGQLVRIFVCMIAPPHDDKLFTRVEQTLALAFADPHDLYEPLLAAGSAGEMIRLFLQVVS